MRICKVLLIDFGKQEHVLTPIQQYLNTRIDKFYDIKQAELDSDGVESIDSKKPIISIRRVDVVKNKKES